MLLCIIPEYFVSRNYLFHIFHIVLKIAFVYLTGGKCTVFLVDVKEECFKERLKWLDPELKGPYIAGTMIDLEYRDDLRTEEEAFERGLRVKNKLGRAMFVPKDEDTQIIMDRAKAFKRHFVSVSIIQLNVCSRITTYQTKSLFIHTK